MSDPAQSFFGLIHSAWAQIGAGVALIVWLVRGEAMIKANQSEISRLWRQREEDLRAHREARETTNDLLNELRQDVKTLLSRRD